MADFPDFLFRVIIRGGNYSTFTVPVFAGLTKILESVGSNGSGCVSLWIIVSIFPVLMKRDETLGGGVLSFDVIFYGNFYCRRAARRAKGMQKINIPMTPGLEPSRRSGSPSLAALGAADRVHLNRMNYYHQFDDLLSDRKSDNTIK